MLLSDLNFTLPPELIAQNPVKPRDTARLLVYNRATDMISHHHIYDLPQILPAQTLIIANNSKVRQGRLFAKRAGKAKLCELLILNPEGNEYRCIVKGKNMRIGETLECVTEDEKPLPLTGIIAKREPNSAIDTYLVRFSLPSEKLEAFLEKYGAVPLPPYITDSHSQPEQYQTVYAQPIGSAAAPTAGLHITPELLAQLKQAGHFWEEVTLHVGLGTFLPLREEELTKNELHTEYTEISEATAEAITQTRLRNTQLLTIGTTSTRTIEAHSQHGVVQAGEVNTNLFIYPGYIFQNTDILMTNFHLPHSSLLSLVAAFLGNTPGEHTLQKTPAEMIATLQRIYACAIAERYRFFSFGDAMLVL